MYYKCLVYRLTVTTVILHTNSTHLSLLIYTLSRARVCIYIYSTQIPTYKQKYQPGACCRSFVPPLSSPGFMSWEEFALGAAKLLLACAFRRHSSARVSLWRAHARVDFILGIPPFSVTAHTVVFYTRGSKSNEERGESRRGNKDGRRDERVGGSGAVGR